jgi:hypothetical protein
MGDCGPDNREVRVGCGPDNGERLWEIVGQIMERGNGRLWAR